MKFLTFSFILSQRLHFQVSSVSPSMPLFIRRFTKGGGRRKFFLYAQHLIIIKARAPREGGGHRRASERRQVLDEAEMEYGNSPLPHALTHYVFGGGGVFVLGDSKCSAAELRKEPISFQG